MHPKEVCVFIALDGQNIRLGTLWLHVKGQKESASFAYDEAWLTHPERFALEPALQLTKGAFHTTHGMRLFGAIGDSAPDRWGRILMQRGEALKAQAQKRIPQTLFEVDYLLGVCDEARSGALRFAVAPETQTFLACSTTTSSAAFVALPKLLSAAENFIDADESTKDLQLLLAPGSSLGGARPKASVRDKDGSLSIAKFPKKDDDYNVVLWETVTLTLAKNAGIRVPLFRVENVCEKPVLIIKRFDRQGEKRIPFLSAMSMLGARDNEQHSYLEMAYALAQNGAHPKEDMHEMWRRIVFTIMVSNTDDHLRNHGFVYERNKGWRLSPAYDINPTPRDVAPPMLTTAIDINDHTASIDTAMRVASTFRLTQTEARLIVSEVASSVKQWRCVASSFGLSKKACDRMSSAFTAEKN